MDLKIREVILDILNDVFVNQAYSNISLDRILKESSSLSKSQKGLITEVVYGTITYQVRLDNIIKYISNVEFKKIEMDILNILRSAMYQIIYLDNSRINVVINETAELAKTVSNIGASKFVNAILRRLIDGKYTQFEEYEKSKKDTDRIWYISSITSTPLWIVRKLLEEYDEEFVVNFLKSSNESKSYYIRVNTILTDICKVKNILNTYENIEYKDTTVENFIEITKGDILNTSLFKEGMVAIQDIAPGIASILLEVKENEKILDACSSPGGKTGHIAMIGNNKLKLSAWDIHDFRVNLVRKMMKQLNVSCVEFAINDATIYDKNYEKYFDKVLLDVPCSGLGVIRKKVDIKQKRKPNDIQALSNLQYDILANTSKYLKIGGTLIYSTCTILKNENEDIVEKFLKENENFKLDDINIILKNNKDKIKLKNIVYESKYIKLYPNINNCDGFFIAAITREK